MVYDRLTSGMADTARFALPTESIYRHPPRHPFRRNLTPSACRELVVVTSSPGWREDLRLFLTTWAAGFVFFLTFVF